MKNEVKNNVNWCFEIEEKVEGNFYEDNESLRPDDEFIVKCRSLDEENNQYFNVLCIRTNEMYDVPASLLN